MTSKLGKQTVITNIFPDILLSKGNQTMKFGRLIKDKFFLKRHTKCDAETNSKQCVEKSKLSIYPWIHGLKFHKVQKSLKIPKYIETKSAFISYKIKKEEEN